MGKILIAALFLPCRGFLNVATAHDRETVLQSKQRNFGAVFGFLLSAATPRHSNYKKIGLQYHASIPFPYLYPRS